MQSIKTRQFNSNIRSLFGKLKVVKLYNLLIEVLLSMEIKELVRITCNQSTWRVHTSANVCNNKYMGKSK